MNVASFMIDHEKLLKGIYVSRKDTIGKETVTTFDVRIKRPNIEPPVEVSAMHTLEHLIAVYLRQSDRSEDIVYVGPMGCRTGMYIIFKGDLEPEDVLEPIKRSFEYVVDFKGAVHLRSMKAGYILRPLTT